MQCRTHPDINGVNTCNQCGEWLCESCTVEINGRIFCRRCLAQLAGTAGDPGAAGAVPHRAAAAGGRHINWGLLFLFSFMPPGVNYMYEGLIKRGLAALSGFFLLVYLTAQFHTWPLSLILGLSYPVYILTCIFDGFNIRRRINAGEAVNDNIDDILNFFRRNKYLILTFIALLLALSLMNSLVVTLAGPFRRWLPIIIIGLGLYVIFRKPHRRTDRRRDDDRNE